MKLLKQKQVHSANTEHWMKGKKNPICQALYTKKKSTNQDTSTKHIIGLGYFQPPSLSECQETMQ